MFPFIEQRIESVSLLFGSFELSFRLVLLCLCSFKLSIRLGGLAIEVINLTLVCCVDPIARL